MKRSHGYRFVSAVCEMDISISVFSRPPAALRIIRRCLVFITCSWWRWKDVEFIVWFCPQVYHWLSGLISLWRGVNFLCDLQSPPVVWTQQKLTSSGEGSSNGCCIIEVADFLETSVPYSHSTSERTEVKHHMLYALWTLPVVLTKVPH